MSKIIQPVSKIPGTSGIPFVGDAVELFTTQEHYYWRCFHRYGSIFRSQIMGMNIVTLIGPEANQFVLQDWTQNFSSKVGWSFLEPILGRGVLLQDGSEHYRTRKLMSPAFHGQAMKSYFHTIQSTVQSFFQRWDKQNTILLQSEFSKLHLDIAFRLVLGITTDQEIQKLSKLFTQLVEGIQTVVRLNIPLTKFGRSQLAFHKLDKIIRLIIDKRRVTGNFNEIQDMLGLLLTTTDKDGRRLSDSAVVTQSLQLLFAGHDTISKLLCWSIFELSSHPEWIERLRAELVQVSDHCLTITHLRDLTEMSYVLKEVERLYPPVYVIPRGVVQDIEFAGYHIPARWHVTISPMLTHRLPELYAKPDLFDPERMAPPREEHKKHPFALIGFGGGAHKCLGHELAEMEIKIILSTLLRHFNWSIKPKYSTVEPVLQPNKEERTLQAEFTRIGNACTT